jgi:hypothetical protein
MKWDLSIIDFKTNCKNVADYIKDKEMENIEYFI